ncbi:asparagine synthase-related protein [Sphingopyxis terrae subsp. ummariensis]
MTLRLAILDGPLGRLPPGLVDRGRLGEAFVVACETVPFERSGDMILFGWAFGRDTMSRYARLTGPDVSAVVASGGAWAVRNLWGNYILVWRDADGGTNFLRSPVTGPPLYQRAGGAGGRSCAFTDIGLARALGFRLDRPDPRVIDASLRFPLLRCSATEIEGVTEILPGEIARFGEAGARTGSWSPWDHVSRPPRQPSAQELHALVHRVVAAWSDRFDRVQLELSGGLDSSIVAACLAARGAPWRALTLVTAGPDGDERLFARAVAELTGVRLAELMLPAEPGDPLAPVRLPRARPAGFGLLGSNDVELLAAANDFGADAIFSGTGGDNVFGYQTSIAPALDALRFAGPRAAVGAAADLAQITGDNLWNALRMLARRLLVPARLWPVDTSLLSQRYAAAAPDHPWMKGARRAPPGQRAYAMGLAIILPFLDSHDRGFAIPKIAPLLSQPLVEYGLGIQSWRWGEGGQDRALARRAFRAELPASVVARRSKGRILSLFLPAFEANRGRLRDFLLGGWLAGEGVIDRDAVDALLTGRARASSEDMIRILRFTDVERWVRSVIETA